MPPRATCARRRLRVPLSSGSSAPLRSRASALSERCLMETVRLQTRSLKAVRALSKGKVFAHSSGVPAECGPGFPLEFVVAAADFGQAFERYPAKLAAGPGERVGDFAD